MAVDWLVWEVIDWLVRQVIELPVASAIAVTLYHSDSAMFQDKRARRKMIVYGLSGTILNASSPTYGHFKCEMRSE